MKRTLILAKMKRTFPIYSSVTTKKRTFKPMLAIANPHGAICAREFIFSSTAFRETTATTTTP
jgi:hypothetical protein